jgi:hypothetical protein
MIVTAQPSLQALQIGVLVQNQIDTQTIHDFCRQINPKIKVHAITQANFSADVLKGKQLDVLILDDEVKNIEATVCSAFIKRRCISCSKSFIDKQCASVSYINSKVFVVPRI